MGKCASACSVAQSCLTLDCSTSGFPVHHQRPVLALTHVHRVPDTPVAYLEALYRKATSLNILQMAWHKGKESTCQHTRCRRCSIPPPDPLEEEMVSHSSVLAWKIARIEKAGYNSWGWRVTHTHTHTGSLSLSYCTFPLATDGMRRWNGVRKRRLRNPQGGRHLRCDSFS